MRKSVKLLLIFAFMFMLPVVYTFGCTSAVDKINAVFSKTEFEIDMESEDDTSQFFDVKVDGVSGNMTNELDFDYQPSEVVTISKVETKEDGQVTYKINIIKGGETNVRVLHKDTNKQLGSLNINVFKKITDIALIDNADPYVIMGEKSQINLSNFVLTPSDTTQSQIKFKLKSANQNVQLLENGEMLVEDSFNGDKITVVAYSAVDDTINCEFDVKVFKRPEIDSLKLYDFNNNDKIYYSKDNQDELVLLKDFDSRKSIDFGYEYQGNQDIKVEFIVNNTKIASVEENNNSYNLNAVNVGATTLRCKVSIIGYDAVYSYVDIPVKVVQIPTDVQVNGVSGDQDLTIYTQYANVVGQKLTLSVDNIETLNGGLYEIVLDIDNKDLFSLYQADGITKIDFEKTVLKNNAVIYIRANEDALKDKSTAKLKVISKRALDVEEDVFVTLNLTASIGTTSIEVDYKDRVDKQDKTVYVELGKQTIISYKLNQGAVAKQVEVTSTNNNLATFDVDVQQSSITITPNSPGEFNISLRTDNGTNSELIPVYIYKTFENGSLWQVSLDNTDFVSNVVYDYGSISYFALQYGHGNTLNIQTNGGATIYDSSIRVNNNNLFINNATRYISGSSVGESVVTVSITTLQPESAGQYGNGNVRKIKQAEKVINVDVFRAINQNGITLKDKNENTISRDISIYMNNDNLDWNYWNDNKHKFELNVNVSPANAKYQSIRWTTSQDFLKVEYAQDNNGDYVLVDADNYIYEKYDENSHQGQTRYSAKKVTVIANPSGNNNGNLNVQSTTGYVTCEIVQYGKVFTKRILVYAKNEVTPKNIVTSKDNVYLTIKQNGAEITTDEVLVTIDQNADNREFHFEDSFDNRVISVTRQGNVLTITPIKAGTTQIKINAEGTRNHNGDYDDSVSKIINVQVSDGKTKATAFIINNEQEFISALRDNGANYYKINSDINLTSNVETANNFNGKWFAEDGLSYNITNITTDNKSPLFKTMNGGSLENINFYFNEMEVETTNDITFACLVGTMTNSTLSNIYVSCNNIKVTISNNVNNVYVGGVTAINNDSKIKDVGFKGNLKVSGKNNSVTNLYVGLISSQNDNTVMAGSNVNYANINYVVQISGNVEVTNLQATNSYVGGVVGKTNSQVNGINSDVNVVTTNLNNVGSVAGFVENTNFVNVISRGTSYGQDNVGGLVGYSYFASFDRVIYEMAYDKAKGEINNFGNINYISGQNNVGGLVGYVDGNGVTNIENSYVKSYETYLVIKGVENIGGLIGKQTSSVILNKVYSSENIVIETNSQQIDIESQLAGFVGSNAQNTNLVLTNTYFKGNIYKIDNQNLVKVDNIKPYSQFVSSVNTSYAIVNESHYLNNTTTTEDLTDVENFLNNGFNITNKSDEIAGKDWFVSKDKNDGYPVMVVDDKIATNEVSIEEIENALSSLDSITNIKNAISSGKLSNGKRYVILTNGQHYDLQNSTTGLFDFKGLSVKIDFKDQTNLAQISNNKLNLLQEGEFTLRITAINNSKIFVDVIVVSVNNATINDIDITVQKDTSYTTAISIGSSVLKLGFNQSTSQCYNVSGGEDMSINGSGYVVLTNNTLTVTGVKVTDVIESYGLFSFVRINNEYVIVGNTNKALNIKVVDKATNISVSLTEMELSTMAEFEFTVSVENAQSDDDFNIAYGNDEKLTKFDKDLSINKVSIDNNKDSFVEVLQIENNFDSLNKTLTKKYKVAVNNEYLDANNIIDFDDFNITLSFSTSSNKELLKQLVIHISKQNILKMTMEYYSSGQKTVRDNVEVFSPNEITTNTIIPGKDGILSINMFPTYSNFDGIYITASGENGEAVYLDQKVLVEYENSTTNKNTKEYIGVRPNLTPVENGIYLRKVSYSLLEGNNKIVSETNLKYDGNLYVMAYISKNTPKNVKFTFKVHTYRLNADGSIDENSIIESREFYLYSEEVPTITIDTSNMPQKVYKDNASYFPLVKGQTQQINYVFANYDPKVSGAPNVICSINSGEGDSIYAGENYCTININSMNAGETLVVGFEISKLVNGVDITDYYMMQFIVVDYIIEDVYLSTDNYSVSDNATVVKYGFDDDTISYPEYSQVLRNIPATLETSIYVILQVKGTISLVAYNELVSNIYSNLLAGNNYLTLNGYNDKDIAINCENGNLKITTSLINSYENALKVELFFKYSFANNQTVTLGNNVTNGEQRIIEKYFTVDSTDSSSIESAYPIYDYETFVRAMNETGHWILMTDLDLTEYIDSNTAFVGYEPKFLSFNGNNYTITAPMISKSNESGSENIGFFKTLTSGQIVKNLKINYSVNAYRNNEDANVNQLDITGLSSVNIGMFVGENNGSIYNCYVDFNVQASTKYADLINKIDEEGNKWQYNVKIDVVDNGDNTSPTINFGGFAGYNTSSGFISNSYVNANHTFSYLANRKYILNDYELNLLINIDKMSKVAGFVVENQGKMSKNAVYNIDINAQDDESVVSGFVVTSTNSIVECFVDNEILSQSTTTNTETGEEVTSVKPSQLKISTKGVASGFVYENSGVIKNAYANISMKTPYRSAGFVYNNSGNIYRVYTQSRNVTGETSRANSLFTGTNELNEINNSGNIEYSYYRLETKEINEYKDVMFDEPASNIAKDNFKIQDEFYGYDFESTWKMLDGNYPTLCFADNKNTYRVSLNVGSGSQGQVKTRDEENGKSFSNPYIVYNANSLLNVLADTLSNSKIAEIYIHLSNDINMKEVENDSRFAMIQEATLIGGIDGNSFSINNLSVLISKQSVEKVDSFGFFSQIGRDDEKITTVKNVDIMVAEMDSSTAVKVGLLAGSSQNAEFINVLVDGEGIVVKGANIVGGLVGYAKSENEIYLNDISSNLTVSAGYDSSTDFMSYADAVKNDSLDKISYAGGIIGVLDFDGKGVSVYNLVVNGKVQVTGDYAGGLFGYSNSRMYNLAFEMMEQENAQHIIGKYSAGGIVAELEGDAVITYARVEVENSLKNVYDTNTARSVNGKNYYENSKVETLYIDETLETFTPKYIGGIVGKANKGSIIYAYNKANVMNYNAEYVGGIVGYMNGGTYVEEAYVTGNVFGKKAGGIVGFMEIEENAVGTQENPYTLDNLFSVVAINNLRQSSTYNAYVERVIEQARQEAENNDQEFDANALREKYYTGEFKKTIYSTIGEISNKSIIVSLDAKDGSIHYNYVYNPNGYNNEQVKLDNNDNTGIRLTYTDREEMKKDYEKTFNISIQYSAENWKSIDVDKSYYPDFLLVTPSNIIKVYTEKDLHRALSRDNSFKNIYIMNDIYLSDYWITPRQTLNATLQSNTETNEIYTIYNINFYGEDSTSFLVQAEETEITKLNFAFGTNINGTFKGTHGLGAINVSAPATYGMFISDVNGTSISDCNFIINGNATYTLNANNDALNIGGIFGNVHEKDSSGSVKKSKLTNLNVVLGQDTDFNLSINASGNSNNTTNFGGFAGTIKNSTVTKINVLKNAQLEKPNDTEECLKGKINITVSRDTESAQVNYVGGFVGNVNNTSMTDFSLDTTIKATGKNITIGGLFGSVTSNGTINVIDSRAETQTNTRTTTTENKKFNVEVIYNYKYANSENSNSQIGGFAGSVNKANVSNINIVVTVNDDNNRDAKAIIYGFAGVISDSEINLCSVNIVAVNAIEYTTVNTEYGAYGFAREVNASTISQCGTLGKIDSGGDIAGFVGTVTNGTAKESRIVDCFADIETNVISNNSGNADNTKIQISGFVINSTSSTIINCYSVGKIVSDMYNRIDDNGNDIIRVEISGFVIDGGTVNGCYSAVAIMDYSLSSYGFAKSLAGNTKNYYLYNMTASEHNGCGIPVDYANLKSAFSGNSNGDIIVAENDDSKVYPYIQYKKNDSSTTTESLEKTLFGDIFVSGTAISPYIIKDNNNNENLGNLESEKYYLVTTNDATVVGDDASKIKVSKNIVLVGFNTNINGFSSISSNSLVAGFYVENTAFVSNRNIVSGNIFNCYANGTIDCGKIDSKRVSNNETINSLWGFALGNEGAISHSSVNVTFDCTIEDYDDQFIISGFVASNRGNIKNCNAISIIKNYKTATNGYDVKQTTVGGFGGFVYANYNGIISNCYAVTSCVNTLNSYAFAWQNSATIKDCYVQTNANNWEFANNKVRGKCYFSIKEEDSTQDGVIDLRKVDLNAKLNDGKTIYARNDDYNYGYPYLVNFVKGDIVNNNVSIAEISATKSLTSSLTFVNNSSGDEETQEIYHNIANPSDWNYYTRTDGSKLVYTNYAIVNDMRDDDVLTAINAKNSNIKIYGSEDKKHINSYQIFNIKKPLFTNGTYTIDYLTMFSENQAEFGSNAKFNLCGCDLEKLNLTDRGTYIQKADNTIFGCPKISCEITTVTNSEFDSRYYTINQTLSSTIEYVYNCEFQSNYYARGSTFIFDGDIKTCEKCYMGNMGTFLFKGHITNFNESYLGGNGYFSFDGIIDNANDCEFYTYEECNATMNGTIGQISGSSIYYCNIGTKIGRMINCEIYYQVDFTGEIGYIEDSRIGNSYRNGYEVTIQGIITTAKNISLHGVIMKNCIKTLIYDDIKKIDISNIKFDYNNVTLYSNENFGGIAGTLQINDKNADKGITISRSDDFQRRDIYNFTIEHMNIIANGTNPYVGVLFGEICSNVDIRFMGMGIGRYKVDENKTQTDEINVDTSYGSITNFGGFCGYIHSLDKNDIKTITLLRCNSTIEVKNNMSNAGAYFGHIENFDVDWRSDEYDNYYLNNTIDSHSGTDSNIGVIAGFAENSTIASYNKNCNKIEIDIRCFVDIGVKEYVGGILGKSDKTIINDFDVTVNFNVRRNTQIGIIQSRLGGVVGYATNTNISKLTITFGINGNQLIDSSNGGCKTPITYNNTDTLMRVNTFFHIGSIAGEIASGNIIGSSEDKIETNHPIYCNTTNQNSGHIYIIKGIGTLSNTSGDNTIYYHAGLKIYDLSGNELTTGASGFTPSYTGTPYIVLYGDMLGYSKYNTKYAGGIYTLYSGHLYGTYCINDKNLDSYIDITIDPTKNFS